VSDQSHEPKYRTTLSGGRLDRLHDRRSEQEWLAEHCGSHGSVHLTWQGQVVIRDNVPAPFPATEMSHHDSHVFLGEIDGHLHWTLDVSDQPREAVEALLPEGASIVALREASTHLSEDDGNILAFAAGMSYWHRTHQFCGSCGAATTSATGGHERKCTECSVVHWPRTDPAVIMLVVDVANDRALLGRQKIWPERMYSTLAGFVEPGESLEDAVARETYEEAGIRVGKIHYWCSQPWPFPRSIMLGFHATYRSGEVVPHPTEMDDARWFTRQELLDAREMGIRGNPMFPPSIAISRVLIDAWLDGQVQLS
jgi:NAD+ diphosphatase